MWGVAVLAILSIVYFSSRSLLLPTDSQNGLGNMRSGDGHPQPSVVSVAKIDKPSAKPENGMEGNSSGVAGRSKTAQGPVVDYLSLPIPIVFSESFIRQKLSVADLPALYAVLNDGKQARHWRQTLWAVCVLADNAEALNVVTRVLSSYWDWRAAGYSSQEAGMVYLELAGATASLSMVDPAFSAPFLTEIFSRSGARKFFDVWRKAELPDMTPFETSILNFATVGAGSGLLHSRSPELFAVVEDTFRRLDSVPVLERTDEERETFHICIQLMAERDIYQELGWERGLEYVSSLSSEGWLNVLLSRSRKYYEGNR